MAERKSGPVKPPVIDLKARDASQPAQTDKPASPGPNSREQFKRDWTGPRVR